MSRTLWGWWSAASGCSPGLRLGLGLAIASHVTNVWFVPPYHHTTPEVLQADQKKTPLQAVVTPTPPNLWDNYPPKLSPSFQMSQFHATHYFWLPFGKDSSKGHTRTFPSRLFPISHVTSPNLVCTKTTTYRHYKSFWLSLNWDLRSLMLESDRGWTTQSTR